MIAGLVTLALTDLRWLLVAVAAWLVLIALASAAARLVVAAARWAAAEPADLSASAGVSDARRGPGTLPRLPRGSGPRRGGQLPSVAAQERAARDALHRTADGVDVDVAPRRCPIDEAGER